MILIALAILAADPSTVNGVLAAAKPGDTVRLVAGNYPQLMLRNRTFAPPLTIDASAATVAGIQVLSSTGVHWTGGTMAGNATLQTATGYGFLASQSKDISVASVHFNSFRTGVVFDRVTGGAITGNWLARMSADGIDIALSRSLSITHNACSEFQNDGVSHPDCIQMWSRPEAPPVADITIDGNTTVGEAQGISLFNHIRDGVDDGGFDRISITNNSVFNNSANGIAVYDCRGCTVRYNMVTSLPNYIDRAQLYVSGGSVDVCGNTVVMVPRQAGPVCAK